MNVVTRIQTTAFTFNITEKNIEIRVLSCAYVLMTLLPQKLTKRMPICKKNREGRRKQCRHSHKKKF